MKLVNLQMAGLNEQQGYVLKLTSAEGYKEERVEVGLERNNFFVLSGINSVHENEHETTNMDKGRFLWDFSSSSFILDFHSTNTSKSLLSSGEDGEHRESPLCEAFQCPLLRQSRGAQCELADKR